MPADRRMSKHTKSGAHLLYDEILSGIIELKVNKNKSATVLIAALTKVLHSIIVCKGPQ